MVFAIKFIYVLCYMHLKMFGLFSLLITNVRSFYHLGTFYAMQNRSRLFYFGCELKPEGIWERFKTEKRFCE